MAPRVFLDLKSFKRLSKRGHEEIGASGTQKRKHYGARFIDACVCKVTYSIYPHPSFFLHYAIQIFYTNVGLVCQFFIFRSIS